MFDDKRLAYHNRWQLSTKELRRYPTPAQLINQKMHFLTRQGDDRRLAASGIQNKRIISLCGHQFRQHTTLKLPTLK